MINHDFISFTQYTCSVLLSPVTCSHRQVDRRTTWPTETGTMVRILRHDPSATWYTGSDEDFGSEDFQLQQQLLQRQQLQDNGFGKRAAGPLDYIMRRKKDLFLRTSRDVGLSSADKDCLEDRLDGCGEGAYAPVLGKRGGKRDNGKGETRSSMLMAFKKTTCLIIEIHSDSIM